MSLLQPPHAFAIGDSMLPYPYPYPVLLLLLRAGEDVDLRKTGSDER